MQKLRSERLLKSGFHLFVLTAICLLLFDTVLSAQISSDNPSQILRQYRQFRTQWSNAVWPFANTLFALLATIEFAWSAAVMMLDRSDLQSWAAALVRKFMAIGAFYALLLFGQQWIPAIVDSFATLGGLASGANLSDPQAGLSPSAVFNRGLNIAGALGDAGGNVGFLDHPATALALFFSALIVFIAFVFITVQYVVAVVESYLVISGGLIFLGFGGSRWTSSYLERYIGLAVSVGVKIMLLYMLIGVGMSLSSGWLQQAQQIGASQTPNMSAFDVMGAAVIFMAICWQIPKLFAGVLGGSPALTAGDIVGTVASVGGSAVAAGAAVSSGGAALAGRIALAAGVGGAAGGFGGGDTASTIASTGGGGGGQVRPPGSPPGGGGGGPKQPSPPKTGGAGGGAIANVASSSNGGSNGVSVPPSRNGNGSSAIASLGGESLSGSGFESEQPTERFGNSASSSVDTGPPAPASAPSGAFAVGDAVMWSPDGYPEMSTGLGQPQAPQREAPGVVAGFNPSGKVLVRSAHDGFMSLLSGSGGVAQLPSSWMRRPTGQEQQAHGAEFKQLSADLTTSVGNAGSSGGVGGTTAPPSGSRPQSVANTAATVQRGLSSASNTLAGLRNRLGSLVPSDGAPHATPPRMPIEHGEE